MEGTVPPQAVELEEAVLGALMLERDSIIAVQEYITSDTFYTEEHRLIYKAIESLSAELKPVDRVRLFATPWTAARQASPSITNSPELAQTHVH